MSYLVFWSVNGQRRTRFHHVDDIRCTETYWPDYREIGGRWYATIRWHGRLKHVVNPIVFDMDSVPPKLMNQTIENVRHWCWRNEKFPQFYVSPVGHIRESATGKIVMAGGATPIATAQEMPP